MRSESAGLLALAVLVLVASLPQPTSGEPNTHATTRTFSSGVSPLATPNQIQETSFASRTLYAQTTFWQNTSAIYGTGSVPVSVASNLSGIPTSTVFASTLTIIPSMHTGMVPMLNVTQGAGATLANATVPYSFTVTPVVSPTPVRIRVPAAFTSTGATPAMAAYQVYMNLSQQVSYFYAASPVWTLTNGSRENLSFVVQVPTGYVLNQTAVFVPFPGIALPNATTFNITKKIGTLTNNLTTYQLVAGGVWAYFPALSSSATLKVAYNVAGLTSGSTPTIPLGVVYSDGPGWFQANATWVNDRTLPWGGQFFITFNSSIYQIVPGSLSLTENLKKIVNSTYSLAGGAIVVLPGTVTVAAGRAVVFQATFQLLNLIPGIRLCVTCSVGGSALTWAQVTGGIELVLIFYTVVKGYKLRNAWARQGASWSPFRGRERSWWAAVYLFVGILIIYVVAALTGG